MSSNKDKLRDEYLEDLIKSGIRGKYARFTEWQKQELDRRLAEFEANPEEGATLEEVFARIRRAS